jgi:predicted 3-demethylubiquinone-9 3-methyltransferase (glyoxalase superfamily)
LVSSTASRRHRRDDRNRSLLWFDDQAEEAAAFYVSIFPESRIDQVSRAPGDNPSTAAGEVLLVSFTLSGQKFTGLNGGPQFAFTEAVSFQIDCDGQAEVDRYWARWSRAREPSVRLAEGPVRPPGRSSRGRWGLPGAGPEAAARWRRCCRCRS